MNQLRKCIVEDLYEIPSIFNTGRYNFDMILSSHRASYNKVGLGYEPKINAKNFTNICIKEIVGE